MNCVLSLANRLQGRYEFDGGSCFDDDQKFSLQSKSSSQYLSGINGAPVKLNGENFLDSSALMTYLPDSKQIYNPTIGCLDDLGQGHSALNNVFSYTLDWERCSTSPTQQFVYVPAFKTFRNPNNPNIFFLAANSGDAVVHMVYYENYAVSNGWNIMIACKPGLIIHFIRCHR